MTITIIAAIWTVIVMSRLENPVHNPQLRLPIMIGAGALAFWLTAFLAREAKEFGWGQVIISVVSFIVVQVVVYLILR